MNEASREKKDGIEWRYRIWRGMISRSIFIYEREVKDLYSHKATALLGMAIAWLEYKVYRIMLILQIT